MRNLEESSKIARETRWAVLARELADATMQARPTEHLIRAAALMRLAERQSTDRTKEYAAILRQIGDARSQGRSIEQLLVALVQLRKDELR